MNNLICPHCHGSVPHGANVCRGCQAELEYGIPDFAHIVPFTAGIFLGMSTAVLMPDSLSFIGWITGIGGVIGGYVLLNRIFSDRVNFKRIYRTK